MAGESNFPTFIDSDQNNADNTDIVFAADVNNAQKSANKAQVAIGQDPLNIADNVAGDPLPAPNVLGGYSGATAGTNPDRANPQVGLASIVATMLRRITGKASWRNSPAANLEQLATAKYITVGTSDTALTGKTALTSVIASGPLSSRPAPSSANGGFLYLVTSGGNASAPNFSLARSNTVQWVNVGYMVQGGSFAAGDLVKWNATTMQFERLPRGAAGQVVGSTGTDLAYITPGGIMISRPSTFSIGAQAWTQGYSVQSAIDVAAEGDTVAMPPGFYTENITLKPYVTVCELVPGSTFVDTITTVAGGVFESKGSVSRIISSHAEGECRVTVGTLDFSTNAGEFACVEQSGGGTLILRFGSIRMESGTGEARGIWVTGGTVKAYGDPGRITTIGATAYDLLNAGGQLAVYGCEYDTTKVGGTITYLHGDRLARDEVSGASTPAATTVLATVTSTSTLSLNGSLTLIPGMTYTFTPTANEDVWVTANIPFSPTGVTSGDRLQYALYVNGVEFSTTGNTDRPNVLAPLGGYISHAWPAITALENTEYVLTVRARNSAGNSTGTVTQPATMRIQRIVSTSATPPTPPAAPTLNAIDNADLDGAYSVTWAAVTGGTFELQEDDNVSFTSPTTIYNDTGTSHAVSGKTEGVYYYRLRVTVGGLTSAWSTPRSATVGSPTPEARFVGVNMPLLAYGYGIGNTMPGTLNTQYFKAHDKCFEYYGNVTAGGLGLNVIRLGFRWERMLTGVGSGAAIYEAYYGYIREQILKAYDQGLSVILDMHNFIRYQVGTSTIHVVDTQSGGTVNVDHLIDAWGKIVNAFMTDSGSRADDVRAAIVGWDLMNEPNGSTTWRTNQVSYYNQLIEHIRTFDTTRTIIVSGYYWSHPYRWIDQNNGETGWDALTDPNENLWLQGHIYAWRPEFGGSGGYQAGAYSEATRQVGDAREPHWTPSYTYSYLPRASTYYNTPRNCGQDFINPWVEWYQRFIARNPSKDYIKLYLGEFGVPDRGTGFSTPVDNGGTGYQTDEEDNPWLVVADEILSICANNNIHVTWWSGGTVSESGTQQSAPQTSLLDPRNTSPAWTDNASAVDRPQALYLTRYLP